MLGFAHTLAHAPLRPKVFHAFAAADAVARTAALFFRKSHSDDLQLEAAATIAQALFGGPSPEQTEEGAPAGAAPSAEERRKETQAFLRRGAEAVSAAAPLFPELAPGIAAAGLRLGAELLQQAAQRLSRAEEEARSSPTGR